jgi:hypothetical protein
VPVQDDACDSFEGFAVDHDAHLRWTFSGRKGLDRRTDGLSVDLEVKVPLTSDFSFSFGVEAGDDGSTCLHARSERAGDGEAADAG